MTNDQQHEMGPVRIDDLINTVHCSCGWLYNARHYHTAVSAWRIHAGQRVGLVGVAAEQGGVVGRVGVPGQRGCEMAGCGMGTDWTVIAHHGLDDWYQVWRVCGPHVHTAAHVFNGPNLTVLTVPDEVPVSGNGPQFATRWEAR